MPFGRQDKRVNRSFKRTPVWMRSKDPDQIWAGGLRELKYVLDSLRQISARPQSPGQHPLAGHDLSYEERCAVGAADAFEWLVENDSRTRDARRLGKEAQALADALTAHDFDSVVAQCHIIAADLTALNQSR
jgi:hypothetical protein